MRRPIFALYLAVACALCACQPEAKQATQVLLEVDAEPEVRARLATLSIDIRGGAAGDAYADYTGEPRTELDAPAFPLQIALVPRGGDASRRYRVTVSARAKDGSLVAEAQVISGYIPASIRFARLLLEEACIGVEQCVGSETAPLTCRAGACADPSADVRDFSVNREQPSRIDLAPPGAEALDGGEAATSDAGVRPPKDPGDGSFDASGSSDAGSSANGGSNDAGAPQATCKLGSSKLSCRLGM